MAARTRRKAAEGTGAPEGGARRARGEEPSSGPGPEARPSRRRRERVLVVVESPAKVRTLRACVGRGYTVRATGGPLKALGGSGMAVAPGRDFTPEHVLLPGKEELLATLREAAAEADTVLVATDPDAEGEALAWHLAEELQHGAVRRLLLTELTPGAVEEALRRAGPLDRARAEAHQVRGLLDRIVAEEASPLLPKDVRRGLSAGRLANVAARLLLEREAEVLSAAPGDAWTVEAVLEGPGGTRLRARLEPGGTAAPAGQAEAEALAEAARRASFQVRRVERHARAVPPPAPFTTATLLEAAGRRLGLGARRTLALARRLYEGVPLGEAGHLALITFPRTDTPRLSGEAVAALRRLLAERLGAEALGEEPQEVAPGGGAAEAIRPTTLLLPPERVQDALGALEGGELWRLYALVWERCVASQLRPGVDEEGVVELAAGALVLRGSLCTPTVAGWRALTGGAGDGVGLPAGGASAALSEGDVLRPLEVACHRPVPAAPSRLTEASLVQVLAERGVGRPATYLPVLTALHERRYVEAAEGHLRPTVHAATCIEALVRHLPRVMDVASAARWEERLDRVAAGAEDWRRVLRDFHGPFKAAVARAEARVREAEREDVPTDVTCDRCGSPMVIRFGKAGPFLACSTYPECRATRDFKEEDGRIVPLAEGATEGVCEACGRPMRLKQGRYGMYLACTGYPECRHSQPVSIGVACPECREGSVAERRSRRGKVFFGCSRYPACAFVAWDRPLAEACPRCRSPYLVQKLSRREGPSAVCPDRACGYRRALGGGSTGS